MNIAAGAYLYSMLCIQSPSRDPYFNLAAEEYLLKQSTDEVFMLWQSSPAVVTGKHQNVYAEMNYRYIREKEILVARRLTGGGTVFHDPGNINFSFIRQGEAGKMVDFTGFIEPLIRFVNSLGVNGSQGPKHEIMVNGKKISGNAEHVFKNRVLHHGTLLFDAALEELGRSIRHTGGTYSDRAVQSNRSSVINLKDCMHNQMSRDEFTGAMFRFILNYMHGRAYMLTEEHNKLIRQLVCDKYQTWDWIYGWSPDYEFSNVWQGVHHRMTIHLSTHRGLIIKCGIASETLDSLTTGRFNKLLENKRHTEETIRTALAETGLQSLLDSREFEDLVFAFF